MGEPIDVRSYLQPGGRRSRDATATLTDELETRIQSLMDTLGPGRPLPASALVAAQPEPAITEARS